MTKVNIFAEIKGIKYKPSLCKKLNAYDFTAIDRLLHARREASFILKIKEDRIAVSWWVSPKRTRSHPYARVYDTLCFSGKKVTIIPIMKDEGIDGDRDFLQWDTISLMSLLGVYVIISYYLDASKNPRFKNKLTKQKFDVDHIKNEILELLGYQSDALHWNLSQLEKASEIAKKALESYQKISQRLNVKMHSPDSAKKRIDQVFKNKEAFMNFSRKLSEKAQRREVLTTQPKELLKGIKATLTIKNYLGGFYYFTCDEIEIHGDDLYIIEGKHSKGGGLPSIYDIKDGLLKIILLTNLENVKVDDRHYNPVPILKLTMTKKVDVKSLVNYKLVQLLIKEANENRFRLLINDILLNNLLPLRRSVQ